ncbi:hypothetical protein LCGC14_2348190, partial [marine sediment metagenome]
QIPILMRNYFKQAILFVFLSLSGFTTKASEASPLLVADESTKTLILQISYRAEITSLKLTDHTNTVIYTETIVDTQKGVKELDMKRFSDGTYTFQTDDALRKMAYTVIKNKSEFKIMSKKETLKPLVRLNGTKLSVLFLNKGANDVSIQLYDARERELNSVIVNDAVIQKTYNLAQTYRGNYIIIIEDSNDTYRHEVLFK